MLPGVVVEVASPTLVEKVRSAITNVDGRYRIGDLPAGTYSVTFFLTGFWTERQDIVLANGLVATLDVRMRIGGESEPVVVTGRGNLKGVALRFIDVPAR